MYKQYDNKCLLRQECDIRFILMSLYRIQNYHNFPIEIIYYIIILYSRFTIIKVYEYKPYPYQYSGYNLMIYKTKIITNLYNDIVSFKWYIGNKIGCMYGHYRIWLEQKNPMLDDSCFSVNVNGFYLYNASIKIQKTVPKLIDCGFYGKCNIVFEYIVENDDHGLAFSIDKDIRNKMIDADLL